MYRFAILLASLTVPILAHAETSTLWEYRGGQQGLWQAKNIASMAGRKEGLQIQTSDTGDIRHPTDFEHRVDVITITYVSQFETEAYFVWHVPGTPTTHLIQLPIEFEATNTPKTMNLNVGGYDKWTSATDVIGLRLPPGNNLVIQNIEFIGYNLFERTWEALKTFWIFDEYHSTNINFLWGPLFTYSPEAREQVFENRPPIAQSANRAFYGILILAFAVLLYRRIRKRAVVRYHFFAVFAVLWLLYDARMGLEYASYFAKDYDTFLSQPTGKDRIFRDRRNSHDFFVAAAPYVEGRAQYLFSSRFPITGMSRYYTYPSLPILSEDELPNVDIMLVFSQPDFTLDELGQIVKDGNVLSGPGEIIFQFDEESFIFKQKQ